MAQPDQVRRGQQALVHPVQRAAAIDPMAGGAQGLDGAIEGVGLALGLHRPVARGAGRIAQIPRRNCRSGRRRDRVPDWTGMAQALPAISRKAESAATGGTATVMSTTSTWNSRSSSNS